MDTSRASMTEPMTDTLVAALTFQNHEVLGHAGSVAGLVSRKYAKVTVQGTPEGEKRAVHLTPEGRRTASEIVRDLEGTALADVREAAAAEARRLLRLGDDERQQPARWVLSTPPGTRAQITYGPFGAQRAQRHAVAAILAGAAFKRVDREGELIEATHLSGLVEAYVVIDHEHPTAPRADQDDNTARQPQAPTGHTDTAN